MEELVGELAKTSVEDDSFIVSFAGRGLKWDKAEDVQDVVSAIQSCAEMRVLKLEGNTLGVDAAKEISKQLESHPELKKALWKDMFTGRLKSEIPDALRFLSSGLQLAGAQLSELDLSDNAFGPIGVEGIAELLQSPTAFALQELRLNNNGLGIQGGKLLAHSLMECHEKSKATQKPFQLKVFICGRNRLENEGATAIAEAFKLIRTLEEVQMPQNGIFFEGIEALANALQYNPDLRHINLNDNIFTEEGAHAMSKILPNLLHLEVINLGDCLIKPAGATVLAKALVHHNKLKEVNLGYNEIDQKGAIDIIVSLGNKPVLEKLELNGNSFGEVGREAVKNALKHCNKLTILGSLSDDDGDDAEDVEDDDEEDEEDNDDGDDKPSNESHNQSDVTEVKNDNLITSIPSTPAEFLASPNLGRFLGLGNNRTQILLDHVISTSSKIEYNVEVFVKVAQFVKLENENISNSALTCCDEMLSRAFNKAEDEDDVPTLSNIILVYLGLIKSEDKSYRPPVDLSGPLLALERCVKQPYFSKSTKEVLQTFLSRFYDSVEKTGTVKHKLMTALFA